ncbi:hypothetical protein [Maricaulis sp.]|uniref:hypothetical protein n=1 Tax=Maricaulis sp. TaxID=1486257 RepID=UPI003A93F68F
MIDLHPIGSLDIIIGARGDKNGHRQVRLLFLRNRPRQKVKRRSLGATGVSGYSYHYEEKRTSEGQGCPLISRMKMTCRR